MDHLLGCHLGADSISACKMSLSFPLRAYSRREDGAYLLLRVAANREASCLSSASTTSVFATVRLLISTSAVKVHSSVKTVPGVGHLTAATLIAYLPELGRRDGRTLTSLVGLAPRSRDSGKKRGDRSIRGGRGTVRRALYICAWAVLRTDGDLCDFYKRLRGRGKPGKVAVTAVARKLLMQLNAVARRGTPWVKQHTNNRPSYQADPA